MKYLKSFDRVNELFGFGKKEKPIDKNKEKEDRINYQKKMISRLFPESIYGSYFDRMEPETFYMLYKIVINFCESIDMGVPYKALIDVLESKDPEKIQEKVDMLKKDKNKIYAIQRIFEVIETGEIYDSKEFYFPFLKKLSDTSLKQLYSYPNAKGTVGDLVMLSKKMNRPVYQILKDKSYIWER